jgi:hypothetical protein
MRSFFSLFILMNILAVTVVAQEKVAEGDYVAHGKGPDAKPLVKKVTHWTLSCRTGNDCTLHSEILGQPAGLRVVQVETLDQHLIPTSMGYDFYRDSGATNPNITVRCSTTGGEVRCDGTFEGKKVNPSAPYKQAGPYWLWMEGLFALDMQWLLDGTVNMAHLSKGSVKVPSVNVLGGSAVLIGDAVNIAKLRQTAGVGDKLKVVAPDKPIPWKIYSDEESLLELVGPDNVQVDDKNVAAQHYIYHSGEDAMNLWVTSSGVLVRFSDRGVDSVLSGFTQYRKLIPELSVAQVSAAH